MNSENVIQFYVWPIVAALSMARAGDLPLNIDKERLHPHTSTSIVAPLTIAHKQKFALPANLIYPAKHQTGLEHHQFDKTLQLNKAHHQTGVNFSKVYGCFQIKTTTGNGEVIWITINGRLFALRIKNISHRCREVNMSKKSLTVQSNINCFIIFPNSPWISAILKNPSLLPRHSSNLLAGI